VRSLATPPLFAALDGAASVLIAGAGGGFDVYAGLPLAIALWDRGATVHLANLSFSQLELLDRDVWLDAGVAAVSPGTSGLDEYFPERTLSRWLAAQSLPSTVHAFAGTGVRPLRAAYRHLVERLAVDAVVIDAYHGVRHTQVLENIAELDRAGAYLGALTIPSGSREATLYRAAVADSRRPGRHPAATEHRQRADRRRRER
jgi:hypothetical protein